MYDGPNIVPIAAMVADQSRAAMLTALMSGEALTATELAVEANITKQTASGHLAKMRDAGLVNVVSQGRHRYFHVANDDVAGLLESLMGIAERTGSRRVRPGPNDPQLRRARVCYDHLAGELGVALYDALKTRRFISNSNAEEDIAVDLTNSGEEYFGELGISLEKPPNSRRPMCRACLDWSVRRHHLAGVVGVSLLNYCYEKKWAKRVKGTRVISFTPRGEAQFKKLFLE